MKKSMKKIAAALMCVAMITGFGACNKEEKKTDVPITSAWKFDHFIQNGEEIPLPEDENVLIPQFSTDDGKHFLFSVTGTSYIEGNLTLLEDGTYELRQGNNESVFSADIDGDKLIVSISGGEGSTLVFKATEAALG